MELELVGKCDCVCKESLNSDCLCITCIVIIAATLIIIAIIGYMAYSKYLSTKIKMAEDEREFKKNEFETKMAWEKRLEEKLTDRKKEDLNLRIEEFQKITYPSAILSKIDNKKMTAEDVIKDIEELKNKVKVIEESQNKDKK